MFYSIQTLVDDMMGAYFKNCNAIILHDNLDTTFTLAHSLTEKHLIMCGAPYNELSSWI